MAFSPHLFFLVTVRITAGGMRPLPEGLLWFAAQSKEHGGYSRRQPVTLGQLDRAVEDNFHFKQTIFQSECILV